MSYSNTLLLGLGKFLLGETGGPLMDPLLVLPVPVVLWINGEEQFNHMWINGGIGVGGFSITLWNRRCWWILLPSNWTRVWWSGPTMVNLFLFGRGPTLPQKELKAHLSPTLKGTKLLPVLLYQIIKIFLKI